MAFDVQRLAGAWNMLWWVVPVVWVIIVASMVYEVRNNPMFQRASPYMNAMDAWEVAFYTHLNEQNGLNSDKALTAPKGSSLPADAWWKILGISVISALFIVKYMRGKVKKAAEKDKEMKTADMNKSASDMKRAQKKAKGEDPKLTKIEEDNVLNDAAMTAQVSEAKTAVAERAQYYLDRFNQINADQWAAEQAGDEAAMDKALKESGELMDEYDKERGDIESAFRESEGGR